MKLHSINTEQGLYVMPCGTGFTHYGFDALDRKARAVAAWAKVIPPIAALGTAGHFDQCVQIMDYGAKYAEKTGTRCEAELVPQLVGLEGQRVEIVDRYGEQRRFIIGKSTGWLPCHIERANIRSTGGIAATGAPFKSVQVVR